MSGTPRPKAIFRTKRFTLFRVKGEARQRVRFFIKEKAKVDVVPARDVKVLDDVANLLPGVAWRTKFAVRIKAAIDDIVARLARSARGPLKERLKDMGDSERAVLIRTATRAELGKAGRMGAVNRVDGLLREIDLWHEFEPATRTARAASLERELVERVRQHNAGNAEQWQEKVQYARRAYTPGSAPKNLPPGEVGDLIAFVYGKKKGSTRIWILMIGNAKGSSNAIELASKEGWFKPWSGEYVEGEFLGQGDFDLERIPEFGLDIPGHGTFTPDQIRVGPRSTMRLGVIPPDVSQAVRQKVENFAKLKSDAAFKLWDSRIPKSESSSAADQLVTIVESGDK
jgi:hypothetical protein